MPGDGQLAAIARPRRLRTVRQVTTTNPLTDPTLQGRQRRLFYESLSIIDRSGAVELADSITRSYGPTGKPVGRPRYFDNRALLAGMLHTARLGSVTKLTRVAEAINELPDDCLAALRLMRNPKTGKAVNLSQVDHAWNRLAEACNPSSIRDGKKTRKPATTAMPNGDDPAGSAAPDAQAGTATSGKVIDRKYLKPHLSDEELTRTPSRAPSNRGTARDLDDITVAERLDLLKRLTDLLLNATIPHGLRYRTLAIDWTDHETTAKVDNPRRASADPDARSGRRRRKGAPPFKSRRSSKAAKTNSTPAGDRLRRTNDVYLDEHGFESDKDEPFFGYILHFGVGVGEVEDYDDPDKPTLPELTVAVRVTPANDMAGVAPAALDIVDSAIASGHPVETLVADLGYSMRRPETLHVPLAERRVALVHDLEKNKVGRKGTHLGAVLINGVPHCPFTPHVVVDETGEPVVNEKGEPVPLTVPWSSASRDEWKKYWERRDHQDAFAFRPLGKRVPGTPQRYECPARAGRVKDCPFYAESTTGIDIQELIPKGAQARDCCGRTFTAPPEMGLAIREEPVHGSRDWVRSHDRRSGVERYNSAVKDFGLDKMDVRVLGIAKRTLAVCFASMATNLRLVEAYNARTQDSAA